MKTPPILIWMLVSFGGSLCAGCGADAGAPAPNEDIESAQVEENGLSVNGLSVNGLSVNGLSVNGLSVNGLSTSTFSNWFNSNGATLSSMVMKYVVRCAVVSGDSRSFTSSAGIQYSWPGGLGLAPLWAGGASAGSVEQQLVSACVAAHVNKFGVNVPISVLGYLGNGSEIPLGQTELTDYPVKEGCFFGNLFTGDGVFVGNDSVWSSADSSSRDCAIAVSGQMNNNCPPMVFAAACGTICVPDSPHNAYLTCSYNGKTYHSINTRVTHSVLYHCGDGICQISEQCGTGTTPNNCKDCGPCK